MYTFRFNPLSLLPVNKFTSSLTLCWTHGNQAISKYFHKRMMCHKLLKLQLDYFKPVCIKSPYRLHVSVDTRTSSNYLPPRRYCSSQCPQKLVSIFIRSRLSSVIQAAEMWPLVCSRWAEGSFHHRPGCSHHPYNLAGRFLLVTGGDGGASLPRVLLTPPRAPQSHVLGENGCGNWATEESIKCEAQSWRTSWKFSIFRLTEITGFFS